MMTTKGQTESERNVKADRGEAWPYDKAYDTPKEVAPSLLTAYDASGGDMANGALKARDAVAARGDELATRFGTAIPDRLENFWTYPQRRKEPYLSHNATLVEKFASAYGGTAP